MLCCIALGVSRSDYFIHDSKIENVIVDVR